MSEIPQHPMRFFPEDNLPFLPFTPSPDSHIQVKQLTARVAHLEKIVDVLVQYVNSHQQSFEAVRDILENHERRLQIICTILDNTL